MLALDVLAAGRADAVLEAERGAVLGRPLRALVAVDDVRHAVFQLARGHRREQVGGHPGQCRDGSRQKCGCTACVAPLLPELCAPAGLSGKGSWSGFRQAPFRQARGGSHAEDDGTGRHRHRRQPRHRSGDRRAVRGRRARRSCAWRAPSTRVIISSRALSPARSRGIKAVGGEATAVAADISSEAECLRLVEAARAAYGRVDTLGEQRRAQLLHPDRRLSDQPLDQGVRRQRPRAVHPLQGGPARHDRGRPRRHRQHQLGLGDRSRPRTLQGPDGARRRDVRREQGRPRALHPGPGAGSRAPRRHRRRLRVAVAGRADAGHGLSQAGRRPRRSARRAALDDGARRAAAGERAGRRR